MSNDIMHIINDNILFIAVILSILSVLYVYRQYLYVIERLVRAVGFYGGDLFHDVHSVIDLSEHGMFEIKPRCAAYLFVCVDRVRGETAVGQLAHLVEHALWHFGRFNYKELAAVCAGTGVSH